MMRRSPCSVAGWIVLVAGGLANAEADGPPPAERAEIARRHGLDPGSPLESRVKATPPAVLRMFEELGGPAPTPHELTEVERRKLAAAFGALPPLHRRVLGERLRSINFLDGMPNTALTSTVNPDDSYRLCDITVRAAIFGEDVSQWLTWKERTCFEGQGSPLRVTIEAGQVDAIAYVLLHEATHVVDQSLTITPAIRPGGPDPGITHSSPFTDRIWSDLRTPDSRYREPLLEQTKYYAGGRVLPIDQAGSVYTALRRTPFASLYGGNNWQDDLAEFVSLHHFTQVLHQPYRIVISRDGREISAYEPMNSPLVRGRFGQMKQFYDVPTKAPSRPEGGVGLPEGTSSRG